MRLIDADALKEDFKARLEKAKNWKENALNNSDDELVIRATATIDFICEVIMTINNAPTVNDCPNCEYKINYGYICSSSSYKELQALRKFKEEHERPQGEWIRRKMNWYICSNCNHKTDSIGETFFNFCPNCGAEMEKGGAEK